MSDFRYGPVEFYLVGFEGDRPDPAVISALLKLVEGGLLRLLDFVTVSAAEDGSITVVEVQEQPDAFGLTGIELVAEGLVGDEDIAEIAALIPAGTSAVLVAFELTYARELAASVAEAGGVVLRSERIPAPVVNALVDVLESA